MCAPQILFFIVVFHCVYDDDNFVLNLVFGLFYFSLYKFLFTLAESQFELS